MMMSSLRLKSLPTQILILPGSPTTPLSDERVPNSTLDVPGDGNCSFYALSYLITGSISQHYELRKAIDRGLGRDEALIIKSGYCLWLVFMDLGSAVVKVHVLTWHKDNNVVLKSEVRLRVRLKGEGDVPLYEHLYIVGVCCIMELQGIQKFHVIGIDSWKGFDDSAILLLDIGMKMESKLFVMFPPPLLPLPAPRPLGPLGGGAPPKPLANGGGGGGSPPPPATCGGGGPPPPPATGGGAGPSRPPATGGGGGGGRGHAWPEGAGTGGGGGGPP
uniref:OTU domain-containing protein n=2 Tax=Amphimedon queenslandica TaxID=400682 RepID=A0A1X7VU62_AMPQE